jgi:hypothetical protein
MWVNIRPTQTKACGNNFVYGYFLSARKADLKKGFQHLVIVLVVVVVVVVGGGTRANSGLQDEVLHGHTNGMAQKGHVTHQTDQCEILNCL